MTPAPSPDPPQDSVEAFVDRLQHMALWAVALVGSVLLYRTFHGYVFEDAYITFRYARNVAEGAGYVFTPGERVFGATAPLHTLSLAVCGFLGADIPSSASVLFAASLGAVGILGGYLLRFAGLPNAAILFAFLALTGSTRIYGYWGIETPSLVAWILASTLAALRRRETLAGALAGLAFLTRYDAAVFALLLFGLLLLRRRRVPWKQGIVAALIVAPWLLFAQLYFGSVLPNTLAAKHGDTPLLKYLYDSASVQLNLIWLPLLDGPISIFRVSNLSAGLSITLGLFAAYGSYRLFRRELLYALLPVFPIVLWIGYGVIGPPIHFTWYLAPAAFCLLVLGCAGVGEGLRWVPSRGAWRAAGFTCILGLLVYGYGWLPGAHRRMEHALTATGFYEARTLAYAHVADWILANDLADLTLMSSEPGYLTYQTRNPAIDSAGLVTAGVYMHGDPSRRTNQNELALERRPGLIVTEYPGRFPNYVAAFSAYPYMTAFLHQDVHEERYEQLRNEYRASSDWTQDESRFGHPFDWNLERGLMRQWRRAGGKADGFSRRPGLLVDGQPFGEDVLVINGFRSGAQSPPFRIDFERLEFRFAGTNRRDTVVRLIIAGRVVLEQGGWSVSPESPRRDFSLVSWPVHHWSGQTARLRLVHVGRGGRDWAAFDHIRSSVAEDLVLLDDFDTGEGYSEFWQETFGTAPTELTPVARRHGVEFDYSPRAALTLGLERPQRMVSRPFTISRDRLCFLAFDFGRAAESEVELLVDGEVVRVWNGRGSRRLNPVTWDVRDLRGREAILRATDQSDVPDNWFGLDDFCLVD